MKKQTILHIIPRFYPGGAERLVLECARTLGPDQYEVHVASCVDDGELRPLFKRTPAHLFVGSKRDQGNRWQIWNALKQYIAHIKPDIVHTHLLSADVSGYLATRAFPHIRWISTLHNVEYHRAWYERVVWKQVLKNTDAVIVVSPLVAWYAREEFHIPEKKLHIIPNGIDLSRWNNIPTDTLFDAPPYQLASIGRLEEQKGHRFLLEALAGCGNLSWEYHLFGEGSLRSSLEARARTLGIAKQVRFHGTVDDVPERLASIDLVIQPSLWEGMSLTVMEAMAAGRPVLATGAAGAGIIADGSTGYVVPKGNVNALRDRLTQILTTPHDARVVAERGRVHAVASFGIETHVDRVKQLYQQICP